MAIIQLSKIINRVGNLSDLPQLSPGEFGWAVDEQRLFIGNDPLYTAVGHSGNTEILTEFSPIPINIASATKLGAVKVGQGLQIDATGLLSLSGIFSNAIGVASGGTGATTLDGYIIGNGTAPLSGIEKIPGEDIDGNIPGKASNVTGIVLIDNGGTGYNNKTQGFDALSPTTMKGSMIVRTAANNVELLAGAENQVLISDPTTVTGLRWANTVSSIAMASSLAGITITTAPNINSPITTNGTFTISGTLGIANGGTGQTEKAAAFDALSPLTTRGDIVVRDGTNNVRLPIGNPTQVLTVDTDINNPTRLKWTALSVGTVTSVGFDTGDTGLIVSTGGLVPNLTNQPITSSGTFSLSGTLSVEHGGTGANNAQDALQNIVGYTPVAKAGDTMTGPLILSADPTQDFGAVTKKYADAIASGVIIKDAVRTSSISALTATYNNGVAGVGATLTGSGALPQIGEVSLIMNDRVLIKDQADKKQNGIYRVSALSPNWTLTRTSDYDGGTTGEVKAGNIVYIQDGALNGTQWLMNTLGTITIGTSELNWTQFSGPGLLKVGTGLSITSNVISNTGVLGIVAGTNIAVSPVTPAIDNPGKFSVAFSGTLGITSGGTGKTTAVEALSALSPLTTKGDLLVMKTSSTPGLSVEHERLAVGSPTQVLTVDTDANNPTGLKWVTPVSGTVTSVGVSTTLPGITVSGSPITSNGTIAITGTLGIQGGGTGQTEKAAAFDALSPLTTRGDIVVRDTTKNTRLALGTPEQVLTVDTDTNNITGLKWTTPTKGTVTSVAFSTGTTGLTVSTGGDAPNLTNSPITGAGTFALAGTLSIQHGGTGANDSVSALNALLPVQTNSANKYLRTSGSVASWDNVSFADLTNKPTTLSGYGITDGATKAYVDTVDYLNLPPLAGYLKENYVPVYGDFSFSLGAWGSTSFALADKNNKQIVYFHTKTPTGDRNVNRAYRFSEAEPFVFDNNRVTVSFLNVNEKVRDILNAGTFFIVLLLSTKTVPSTTSRVVIAKTGGSSDPKDWTLAYDVTALFTGSDSVNFSLVSTNSGDRILVSAVNNTQTKVTLRVYNSELVLLRSQELYDRPSMVNTADTTGAGRIANPNLLLLSYAVNGSYGFTWNSFSETFHQRFSSWQIYQASTGASVGVETSISVSWTVPKSWIENGSGQPDNLIPIKSGTYRYNQLPDTTWDTDTGGMGSTLVAGGSSTSIVTDEYTGTMFFAVHGTWDAYNAGNITLLPYSSDYKYKTLNSNITSSASSVFDVIISDGSLWAKEINSSWTHVIGNNLSFYASSAKNGAKYIQTTFSTSTFGSIGGQSNDTLNLDSAAAIMDVQNTAPTVIRERWWANSFGTTVVGTTPTYYWCVPGQLLHTITVASDGINRTYTSTGITVPEIPITLGDKTGLTFSYVSAWNASTVAPIFYALVRDSVGAVHLLRSTAGTWSMVITNAIQTAIDSGKQNRGDNQNLIYFNVGQTLLTASGRLLFNLSIPAIGGTLWYWNSINTTTFAETLGDLSRFTPTSTNYIAPNGYPGSSFGYSTTLGYFRATSAGSYDSLSFISSKDIRGVGAELTEEQWFNASATRYQVFITVESSTGLVVYTSSFPIFIGGYLVTLPSSSVNLLANTTNYIYVTKTGTDRNQVALTTSQIELPSSFSRVLIARITTDSAKIVSQENYLIRQRDTIDELLNVDTTGKTPGSLLSWNGSKWGVVGSAGSVGSVTSVTFSGGTTGLTTVDPPITTSGTITLSGTLVAANGGTGISTYAVGDMLYANSTTTLAKLASVAQGAVLLSGGVGAAPLYGKVQLSGATQHVTGTLSATNGGTGASAYTVGDILYADTATTIGKLSDTVVGNVLLSGGVGAAPSYGKVQLSGATQHVTGTLAVANGGTGATTRIGASNSVANFGQLQPHTTVANFNDVQQWGSTFVAGTANGPATNSATQYYQTTLSLGSDFDWGSGNVFAAQIAIPRNVANPYISIRYKEGGANALNWGTWQKINAGYADTAGSATNVSGVVSIANGGTGKTNSVDALNALLPTQNANNANYLLKTDGAGNVTWSAPQAGYTLPTATASALGGIKIGSGLVIDANSVVTVDALKVSDLGAANYRSGRIDSASTGTPLSVAVRDANGDLNARKFLGIATSADALNNTLSITKGGTGQTEKVPAFNALSPLTTKGDLLAHDGTNNIRIPVSTTNGHALMVDSTSAAGVSWKPLNNGTVTSVSVADANGFSGTVATNTSTPSISIKTNNLNGIIKSNSSGVINVAVAGTDYQAPITLTTTGTSGAATFSNGTLNIPNYAGTVTSVSVAAANGFSGTVATNTTTPSISIKTNGIAGILRSEASSGAISSVTIGTGLNFDATTGTLSSTITSNSGTVTSVSVATANGFSGTVATNTTTPSISIKTNNLNGIIKSDSNGVISVATAGTDFQSPITLSTNGTSGAATFNNGTLNIPNYSVTLTTTGTSGAATFNNGTLNIPNYSVTLTTTGTSGAATFNNGTLNIPNYSVTLTTTGTSGAATFNNGTLNIPNYAGTVSSVSVATANGFSGTVATNTTTPSISIKTNGIAGILRSEASSGAISSVTIGTGLNFDTTTGTLSSTVSGGGSGTVTSVSVATANGFSGTVATNTTTPSISIKTNNLTGIIKSDSTGAISVATSGTDFQAPITLSTNGTSGAATFSNGTLNIPNYATGGSSYTLPAASSSTRGGIKVNATNSGTFIAAADDTLTIRGPYNYGLTAIEHVARHLYIRSTGASARGAQLCYLDGTELHLGFSTANKGITLIILSSTLQFTSKATYNTSDNGSQTSANLLANAIAALTANEVGILLTYDNFELNISSSLRTQARAKGLHKLADVDADNKGRAYAAVFSGAGSNNAIEVMISTLNNNAVATLTQFLQTMTGQKTAGTNGGPAFTSASSPSLLTEGGNTSTTNQPVVYVSSNTNVGIGTTTPTSKLQVNGSFAATTKNFVIDHPTKPDMKLSYGSLEGPEYGVYVRGKLTGKNIIQLPDYWTGLVRDETITVTLTSIGKQQHLYVSSISNNQITICSDVVAQENINCHYTVHAERADTDRLQVEIPN